MPKVAKELGPLDVKRISGVGTHAVGGVPGLMLQVGPTGTKSWLLRTRVGDKRREIGLGPFPAVGLALAREKAQATREDIGRGIDPVARRAIVQQSITDAQAEERAMAWTFRRCAEAYIKAKSHEWKNSKHVIQWTNTLERYAHPVIGDLTVRHINIGHITQVLEPHWITKTQTMDRVRNRIELVLDWATASKYRTGDNPAVWKGNLDKLLASPGKVAKKVNHQALPANEVYQFIKDLRARNGNKARCLEFLTLTACRSGEARGATWSEIDLASRTWTVPAARMKAGREQRVPLSESVIEILAKQCEPGTTPDPASLIFPGRYVGIPLSVQTLSDLMHELTPNGVPHGLRSTFSSWVASSTAYPIDVREMALAHSVGDSTSQAYQRSDLFEKRAQLMNDWAIFCEMEPQAPGSNVLQLRAG